MVNNRLEGPGGKKEGFEEAEGVVGVVYVGGKGGD